MTTDRIAYRESHAAPGYGSRYDENYATGYYAAIYRELEVPMLEELFAEFGGTDRKLLDFACGTGRITRIGVGCFGSVVGVDVSEAMLAQARPAVPGARFLRQDLTEQPLEERFDVVTSFRFFLNAEDELRRSALAAIRAHLHDGGRLICNIHMNRNSIMGAVYGFAKLLTGRITHKTLSFREFEAFLVEADFSVEKVIWYGVTPRPGRLFARFLDKVVGPVERLLNRAKLNGPFAHSFLVVAKAVPSAAPEN
jgi:SAM-dependent methyltransferase